MNRLGQRFAERPSLLKTACDDAQKFQLSLAAPASSLSCSCRTILDSRRKMSVYRPVILYREYSMKSFHSKECPFWTSPQKKHSLGLRICSNTFLKGILSASMSASRGAGGYSIAPNIHFRSIVPTCSPAFTIIRRISHDCSKVPDFSAYLATTLLHLRRLFASREASVSDTDKNGNTLLHVCKIRCSKTPPFKLDF